jgi:hypothetical protein
VHDVFVQNHWTAALEVGHDIGASTGGQRQVHRYRLSVGLGFRLVEVGVTIDKQQSVTPPSAEGQQVAEQYRAIAAEDDWNVTNVEHVTGRVGELVRVVPEPDLIDKACGRRTCQPSAP